MNENSDIFDILNENECYFFSYGHLSIELLSTIFERKSETFLYKNCYRRGFERIFCVNNDNEAVASIYNSMWESVYGIIVKITYDELDLLESYHKNYDLCTIDVSLSYSMLPDVSKEGILKNRVKKSYVFIHKNEVNEKEIQPSEIYLQSIRNMLNDRKKINPSIITKPIKISCVKINESNNEKYISFIDVEKI
jgi:hypothetical protein